MQAGLNIVVPALQDKDKYIVKADIPGVDEVSSFANSLSVLGLVQIVQAYL